MRPSGCSGRPLEIEEGITLRNEAEQVWDCCRLRGQVWGGLASLWASPDVAIVLPGTVIEFVQR